MIIEITPEKKLKDISMAFNKVFPFLKLEFFNRAHKWQESSSITNKLNQEISVAAATKNVFHSGYIEFHYWQKTGLIEMRFLKQFNLNVQIYKLVGNTWIQTAGTDELTLEEQNESGLATSLKTRGDEMAIDVEKKM